MDQIVARHLFQQVDVPGHQVILGDDSHRVAVPQKHFEAAAGQGEAAFERLVRVRIAGQGHDLRRPGFLLEGLRQQFGRPLLHKDAGFEIEARRKAEVFVGWAGVTIHAPVLAAPVRIQAVGKADVRAVVAGQQGFRGVHIIGCGRLAQVLFVQRGRVLFEAQGFEAIRGIDAGAPPLPNGQFNKRRITLGGAVGKRVWGQVWGRSVARAGGGGHGGESGVGGSRRGGRWGKEIVNIYVQYM